MLCSNKTMPHWQVRPKGSRAMMKGIPAMCWRPSVEFIRIHTNPR
jgi:hypothetical protein